MKNPIGFSILFCMSSMLFIVACEKAEIHNNEEASSLMQIVEFRSSCQECPGTDECCCGVWVQNALSGYAKISLCGTSDGTDGCSGDAIGDCSSFSGGGQSFELAPPTIPGKRRFCMNEGDTFWIANTHPTLSMDIYLTCQDDITNAQVLQITIPAGQRWYYEVDNACELTLCTEG